LADLALATSVLSGRDAQSWPELTADERATMGSRRGLQLWQIYALIPDEPRAIIRYWVSSLAEGMRQIEDPGQPPSLVSRSGARLFADVADYKRYSYFVAGPVGHMATELVIQHYGLADNVAVQLRANSEACGRGLQKTNIVKDYAQDLSRDISYLPD
jgi:phytoene/squalene synthetase